MAVLIFFTFQQDLPPVHTAKYNKSCFNDHGFAALDWPANSPALNPIENLWAVVKKKTIDTRHNNADDPNVGYQSNLGFHDTYTVPRARRLNAATH